LHIYTKPFPPYSQMRGHGDCEACCDTGREGVEVRVRPVREGEGLGVETLGRRKWNRRTKGRTTPNCTRAGASPRPERRGGAS
jgi:hypothetical protein